VLWLRGQNRACQLRRSQAGVSEQTSNQGRQMGFEVVIEDFRSC
jgi:hypothetical protein